MRLAAPKSCTVISPRPSGVERLADLLAVGGLSELELDHAAADEIDAVVEPDKDQQENRRRG